MICVSWWARRRPGFPRGWLGLPISPGRRAVTPPSPCPLPAHCPSVTFPGLAPHPGFPLCPHPLRSSRHPTAPLLCCSGGSGHLLYQARGWPGCLPPLQASLHSAQAFRLPARLVLNPGHPLSQGGDPGLAFLSAASHPHPHSPARSSPRTCPWASNRCPARAPGWAAAATAARRARTEREPARGGSGGSCCGRPGGARGAEGQARAPGRTRVHTRHVCPRSRPPVRLGPAHTRAHSPENLPCTSARGARCSPAPPGRPRPPPRRAALAPPAAPPLAIAGSQGSRARPPRPGCHSDAGSHALTPPTHPESTGGGREKGSRPTPRCPWVWLRHPQ